MSVMYRIIAKHSAFCFFGKGAIDCLISSWKFVKSKRLTRTSYYGLKKEIFIAPVNLKYKSCYTCNCERYIILKYIFRDHYCNSKSNLAKVHYRDS